MTNKANTNTATDTAADATAQAEKILNVEGTANGSADKKGFFTKVNENKTDAAIKTAGVIGGLYALGKGIQFGVQYFRNRNSTTAQ